MTLALEIALVVLIVHCVYRAGVVRERARWVGFVKWTASDADGDAEFADRILGANVVIESRGWQ